MSSIEMKPMNQTNDAAEAVVFLAKPEKKYWPMTRLLATGSTQGDMSQLSRAGKIKAFIGVIFDVIGAFCGINIYLACKTYFENKEIRAFNKLSVVDQAAKNLNDQLDKCRDAALAFAKNPTDHKKNLELRTAIRETTLLMQINKFLHEEKDFEQLVKERVSKDLGDKMVMFTPHQKNDAHTFEYSLKDLVLKGFYPFDKNGNNSGIQGVVPESITFRFEDGIFAPSKEGIINIFFAQSSVDLVKALENLKSNLATIERPQEKDSDKIRTEIRTHILEKLKDVDSPEFQMMADGATHNLQGTDGESYAADLRKALIDMDFTQVLEDLEKKPYLPLSSERLDHLATMSNSAQSSEEASVSTKLVNTVKTGALLGAVGVSLPHLPIIGGHISNAATNVMGSALSYGSKVAANHFPNGPVANQLMQFVGTSSNWVASAANSAYSFAQGFALSSLAELARRLPEGVQSKINSAITTATPYAIPAASLAIAGYGLYKAFEYATAQIPTNKHPVVMSIREALNTRNHASQVLVQAKKEALVVLPAEAVQDKVSTVALAITKADEARIAAEELAQTAFEDLSNTENLKRAQTAAFEAQKEAIAAAQVAENFQQQVVKAVTTSKQSYTDLSDLFKQARKILKNVNNDLGKFNKAITNGDKRNQIQKELDKAQALLDKFNKVSQPQVTANLELVAGLQQQIADVLANKQADPTKNWEDELASLRRSLDTCNARNKELTDEYNYILNEIARLKQALSEIETPKTNKATKKVRFAV